MHGFGVSKKEYIRQRNAALVIRVALFIMSSMDKVVIGKLSLFAVHIQVVRNPLDLPCDVFKF